MSSRNFEIQVDDKEVLAALEQMQRRSMDLKPFMGAVGMIMIKAVHSNFEAEGRPKWKGWSPLTQEIYEETAWEKGMATRKTPMAGARQAQRSVNKLASAKILQNTGELKKSVVLGPVTANSVEVGSSLVYARIHQLGGEIHPVKAKALRIPVGSGHFIKLQKVTIPARPFLQLQEADGQTIMRIAEDYLMRGAIG